jgi:hypothetical protein
LPKPDDESAVPKELVPGVLKGWPVRSAGDPSPDDPSAGDPKPGDPKPGDPKPGDPKPCDPIPSDPIPCGPAPCDPMPPRANAVAEVPIQRTMQRTESLFMSKLPFGRERKMAVS